MSWSVYASGKPSKAAAIIYNAATRTWGEPVQNRLNIEIEPVCVLEE
jgi:hypothetical protein